MMVALVGLLNDWHRLSLTDYGVAEYACRIEREELGIPGGLQDQYAATFGGFNFIEFLEDRVIVNPLRVSAAVQNELQYNLLLAFTGQTRMSSGIIEDQVKRFRAQDPESVHAFRELKRISVEMKNCILQNQLDGFGRLLHEQWGQKKRTSSRISTPELDTIYDAALRAGATGGKITGAGGGGYMLFYCPRETRHEVARRLDELGCTISDFSFEPTGLQTWRVTERE
jgi:D-glycero-alpha-D-manno-heptose-7-phosphate kinase